MLPKLITLMGVAIVITSLTLHMNMWVSLTLTVTGTVACDALLTFVGPFRTHPRSDAR